MSRLDALRALLAQHTPTPDDARIGHRYVYSSPDRTRVDLHAKDRERTA